MRAPVIGFVAVLASSTATLAQQIELKMPSVGTVFTYTYWDGDGASRQNERTVTLTVERLTTEKPSCPEQRLWPQCAVVRATSPRGSETRVMVDGRIIGTLQGQAFTPVTRDYVVRQNMKSGDTWSYIFDWKGHSYRKDVTVRDWHQLSLPTGQAAVLRVSQVTDNDPGRVEQYDILPDGTIAHYAATGFEKPYGYELQNVSH